ncbi:MAG: DUF3999 family protein [Pseudomonadota bacterium]
MKILSIALAALALQGAPAVRAAPQPDSVRDYSHTMAVNVSGSGGVVRLELPQQAYVYARSAGLDDVRVFDAGGAALPFALRERARQRRTESRALPVKVFPIHEDATRATALDGIALDVHTGADGTLLSIQTQPRKGGAAGAPARLAGLVLDLRQGDQTPQVDALRFTLPSALKTYRAQLWVESSDDLKQWEPLGTFALTWMVNGSGQTLSNDSIEFPQRRFRYARLSWREGEPLEFAQVRADAPSTTEAAPARQTLLLQALPGKVEGDLVYTGAIAIPVQQLGLQFSEPNVVLPAQLGSYRELPSRQVGKPSTWLFEQVFGATFYHITQGAGERASGDVTLPSVHLAQWVLRPQASAGATPQLRLAWTPATLLFLANGKGPFTLAFGRDGATSMQRDITQVAPGFSAAELDALAWAKLGPAQAQGAAKPATAADAPAAQQRLWILWGVLLLGVAVLAALAWRLMKQMRE